jgi:hypothetical protein
MNEQTQELLKKLEDGVKNVMNSESFKEYLKFQSTFHNYSFNNTLLILLQKPDASMVAGYKSWEKLGRHVMRGEKGIRILAPSPYKVPMEVPVIDPKTDKPKLDAKGNMVTEKREVQKLSFKPIPVFDVSQTDGKEIPSICKTLEGNSQEAARIIKAVKEICEIPIYEEPITSGAKGYFDRTRNIIAVNEGMSLEQTAKTLIHEYAHYKLHSTVDPTIDRATKEVQAESTAFVVSNHFGVDTGDYSFEYIASWSSGKELAELKFSLDTIQKASSQIIDKMHNSIEKQLELENSGKIQVIILGSEDAAFKRNQILSFEEANEIFKTRQVEHTALRLEKNKNLPADLNEKNIHLYEPYNKVRFKVELPNGKTFGGKFIIGENEHVDLYHYVKSECQFDVYQYQNDLNQGKAISNPSPGPNLSNVEQVVTTFKGEFPAIKHLAGDTAQIMAKIVKETGVKSIKELKANYKQLGKQLENSNDPKLMKSFNEHKQVVEGLKSCTLEKAKEKALSNATPTKTRNIDMGMGV